MRPIYQKRDQSIFAVYQNDQYLFEGTASDIAKRLDISREYIFWSQSPAAQKRMLQPRKYHSKRYFFVRVT